MKIGSYPDDDEYMGHVGHEAFFSRGLCNHPSHDPTQAARETPGHTFRLVFEDEVGDLARCSCGEQGFDFQQGREWFEKHLAAVAARETLRPDPLTDAIEALTTYGTTYSGPGGEARIGPVPRGRFLSRDDVLAALRAATPDPAERHPESCERCGRGNITWHAPSPLWNAVMRDPTTGDDRHSIVCPFCFVEIAEAKGFLFSWHLGPHEDVSGLWTDTDGRAWDATKCLWAAPLDPAEPRGQAVFGCTALDCALTEGHTGPHAPDRVASTVEPNPYGAGDDWKRDTAWQEGFDAARAASTVEPTYLDEVSYQSGFEDGRAVTNAEPGLDVGALREAITLAAWGYDFGSPIDAGRVGRDLAGKVAKHYAAHLALTPDEGFTITPTTPAILRETPFSGPIRPFDYNTIDPKDGGRNDR